MGNSTELVMIIRNLLAVGKSSICVIDRYAESQFFGAAYVSIQMGWDILGDTLDDKAISNRPRSAKDATESDAYSKGVIVI